MNVCMLSSKEGAVRQLAAHCGHQVTLECFSTKISDFTTFDAVVLIEPYECKEPNYAEKGGLYTSVFEVWKRYLAHKSPRTKLLVGGYWSDNHPNFIPLLELSPDFDFISRLEQAYETDEEWLRQLNLQGIPLLDKLQRFFKGHSDEGIIDTMSRVRQSLSNAFYQMDDSMVDFKEVWEETLRPRKEACRMMLHRWKDYEPFFKCTPFFHYLETLEVRSFFKELFDIFSGSKWIKDEELWLKEKKLKDQDAFNRLAQIQRKLKSINKKYIHPEIIAEVLVIDDDRDFHAMLENFFPVFQFYKAFSKEEGLRRLEQRAYGFILLDLELRPGENKADGLELIAPIKNKFPDTPLIVASTHDEEFIQQEALKRGASYFLTKTEYDFKEWYQLFEQAAKRKNLKPLLSQAREIQVETEGRILVVEDEDDWYHQHINNIREFNFTRAKTPQQAIDLIRQDPNRFDLISVDLYFVDHNGSSSEKGLKLTSELKKIAPDTPIIVVTKDSKWQMAKRAIDIGATDYFPKEHFNYVLWTNRMKNYILLKRLMKLQQPI